MVTPVAKRQAVAHLVANHEMSERRACRVIGCCRMTMRYEVVRQDDPVLRERLKELAKVRRRFGYRRLHVFLRREGHEVNHKRLFRIYREEQLHVRRRGGRKRAMGTRAPMVLPLMPNQRWSLDFVSDQLTDGRRFRILTVVDDCTRECLALIADTSLSAHGWRVNWRRYSKPAASPRRLSAIEPLSAIDGVDGSRSRHRNVPHWVLSL